MSWKFFLMITVLFLVVQCVVMPSVMPMNIKPDFVLLLIVNLSLYETRERAIAFGFVAGIMQDAFSSVPTGSFALAKTVAALAVSAFSSPLIPENRTVHVIGVLIGLAVQNTILFLIMTSAGLTEIKLSNLYLLLGLEAVYTLFFYPVLFHILNNARSRKRIRHGHIGR